MTVKYKQQLQEEIITRNKDLPFEPHFEYYELMSFLKEQLEPHYKNEVELQKPPEKPSMKLMVRVERKDEEAQVPEPSKKPAVKLVVLAEQKDEEVAPKVDNQENAEEEFEYLDVVDEEEEFELLDVVDEEEFNLDNVKEEPPEIIHDEGPTSQEIVSFPTTSTIKEEPIIDDSKVIKDNILVNNEAESSKEVVAPPKRGSIPINAPTGLPPFKKIRLSRNNDLNSNIELKMNGSDEDFLKSVLPFFQKMNESQNMKLRNSLKKLIFEELVNKEDSQL